MDDLLKQLKKENRDLRNEIIMLKNLVKSLKMQLSESNSDLIVEKANKRGRP